MPQCQSFALPRKTNHSIFFKNLIAHSPWDLLALQIGADWLAQEFQAFGHFYAGRVTDTHSLSSTFPCLHFLLLRSVQTPISATLPFGCFLRRDKPSKETDGLTL